MEHVDLVIEGPQADAAAQELLAAGWASGQADTIDGVRRDPGTLALIVQIVAIAGGTVTIADKLLSWWEKWRKPSAGGAQFKVLMKGPGDTRLLLDGASADEIATLLKTLPQQSRP